MPTLDDDSGSDREDELPQVVVLQSGDLTAEEAKKIKEEQHPGKGGGISSSTGRMSQSRPLVLNWGYIWPAIQNHTKSQFYKEHVMFI